MNSDHFLQLYIVLCDSSVICACGPPQIFQNHFYLLYIHRPFRSIEQNVLMTNIAFFLEASPVISEILDDTKISFGAKRPLISVSNSSKIDSLESVH